MVEVEQFLGPEVTGRLGAVWGLGSGSRGDPGPWEGRETGAGRESESDLAQRGKRAKADPGVVSACFGNHIYLYIIHYTCISLFYYLFID